MSKSANDYGKGALDFIERLERLTTVDAALDEMQKAFNRFGFETIILAGILRADQRLEHMVLAKRWPEEWFKLYTENEYVRVDPCVRYLYETANPFEWAEAPYHPEREPRAAEVMNRAAEFGLGRGFAVPIHTVRGYKAAVSLGGRHLDLNFRSKAAIHLMSLYAFDRVCRLIGPPIKIHALSEREREVIAWLSRGKSAWEIGEILGITQRTVEEHSANARRKLGAVTTVQAVAIAIREGLINP